MTRPLSEDAQLAASMAGNHEAHSAAMRGDQAAYNAAMNLPKPPNVQTADWDRMQTADWDKMQREAGKGPPVFSLVRAGDLKPRPMDWLISGLYERDSLLQIFGPAGGAKTFTALDMACCIATGNDYHGRKVQTGPVVYIAGEGFNGLARRRMAWEIVNKTELGDAPLFISTMPAALLDITNLSAVMKAINQTECKPVMVVLDTLARNFGPGDENSTADMTGFVAACDQIRSAYDCTVCLVHHTGHGEQQRSRGSSVLNGAIDASYRITRDPAGPVLVENTKMKDAMPPEPFAFKFETVELGFDNEDGSPATSAVLAPCPVPERKTRRPTGKSQTKALAVLDDLHAKHRKNLEQSGHDPSTARVQFSDWRDACLAEGIPKRSFYNVRDALNESEQITLEAGGFVSRVP